MPKHLSNARSINVNALNVVRRATEQTPRNDSLPAGKNPSPAATRFGGPGVSGKSFSPGQHREPVRRTGGFRGR
jgi:hypothetical protein